MAYLLCEAAKMHIVGLLNAAYPNTPMNAAVMKDNSPIWYGEYRFDELRLWRFDYAVPSIKCAIEIDGGTFKSNTGHNSGIGLRTWREKNNAAMSLGWRVWHYAPEEVIKAGRKGQAGSYGWSQSQLPP